MITSQFAFSKVCLQWQHAVLQKRRWEQVTSLGDTTLFLGNCISISVTASDFPESQTESQTKYMGMKVFEVQGCKPNSIYFSEGKYAGLNHIDEGGPCIFDLNRRTKTGHDGLLSTPRPDNTSPVRHEGFALTPWPT